MSTRVSRPARSKKLSCCVRPGVFEMRASVRRPVSALTRLDLPTFERPAKAISSPVIGGRLSIALAAQTNPASPAKSLRPGSRSGAVMTELSGAMPGLASEGGAMSVTGNLFAGLPGKAAAEAVETLVRSPAVRIERIHRLDRAGEPAGVLVRPAPGRVDRGARRLRRAPRRGRGRAAHAPGRRPRPLAGPL